MQIYVAGPFFNPEERSELEKMINYLRKKYPFTTLFIPMEHFIPDGELLDNDTWANLVYKLDTKALENSQLMVAMYTDHYSDTGTAFEIGYATAKGIPVYLYIPEKYQQNNMSIMPIQACTDILTCDKHKLNQK